MFWKKNEVIPSGGVFSFFLYQLCTVCFNVLYLEKHLDNFALHLKVSGPTLKQDCQPDQNYKNL